MTKTAVTLIFVVSILGFSVCSQVAQAHAEEDNEIDPLVSKQGYPVASGYAAASEYSADSGYPAVSSYPADPTYATGSGYAAQSAYPTSEYAAPGEYPLQSYSQQSIIERQSVTSLASMPMILTAFAAAFLGSLVAPFFTSGVMQMIGTDEFRVPDIQLPRIKESGSV
eukprot:TRINITY_DN15003_c0_g1_i1.p1 TRINITY_DN15003_c0_g1~~TRINITY_DN15003_c0_g1_i1.p1  ORF type:complete len:168 (-),score=32.17 TRINITY_DN15003_c0_g1_i1:69-572(-)